MIITNNFTDPNEPRGRSILNVLFEANVEMKGKRAVSRREHRGAEGEKDRRLGSGVRGQGEKDRYQMSEVGEKEAGYWILDTGYWKLENREAAEPFNP